MPAVQSGLVELRKRLNAPATGDVDVDVAGAVAGGSEIKVEVSQLPVGQPPQMQDRAANGFTSYTGPVHPEFTTLSWAAHFVEVRVEPTTRRIRVPRALSVVDCGRVASPVTAASQVRGGVVWGIGGALREEGYVDERFGGFLNSTLEEYKVPVNADIHRIDVEFIDKPDLLFNSVGVKGLGEVATVGVVAAVANAVYHATGRRQRRVPIRIEHVL